MVQLEKKHLNMFSYLEPLLKKTNLLEILIAFILA